MKTYKLKEKIKDEKLLEFINEYTKEAKKEQTSKQ